MHTLTPSIFGRFFSKKSSFTFNEKGVEITLNHSNEFIPWHELVQPIAFEFGFLGQVVTFSTVQKNYTFIMKAYASEYLLKANSDQHWVNSHYARLETLLNQITKKVSQRFLRQSSIEQIRCTAVNEHKRWFPWINKSKSFVQVAEKVQLLDRYSKWDHALTDIFQTKYINEQLDKYKEFFNNVEANPLTKKQRIACVIDNDNNLLLAGAGTGKTSVIVGRAGFLVESKQANYNDMLLLAYGRKAADEMDERIKKRLATNKIKASTFHSIGLNIISSVEGTVPQVSAFYDNDKLKAEWLEQCFESLIEDNVAYRKRALKYLNQHDYTEKSVDAFNDMNQYNQYLKNCNLRSLNDEHVNSFAELHMANWFFTHGVNYQYNPPYAADVKTEAHKKHQPSFYLPEHDLYIEYCSVELFIAENSDVIKTVPLTANSVIKPSYVDETATKNTVQWIENTHKKNATQCLVFTYSQYQQGTLFKALKKALSKHNVQYQVLSSDVVISNLRDSGKITSLAKLLGKLLGLYKSVHFGKSSQISLAILNNAEDEQQCKTVLALLKPILKAYNLYLREQNEIDFDDMITKAIGYVESGRFKSPWRYLMVDEFQDISAPRARLVKALRDNYTGSSVFAVGDDWQAIYRFSGADMRFTTEFSKYFGFTTQAELDLTFRFNDKIGQVASEFIRKNPVQLDKKISSLTKVSKPAISVIKTQSSLNEKLKYQINHETVSSSSSFDEISQGAINDTLQTIQNDVTTPTTVYVLARFWYQLPKQEYIQQCCDKYPLLSFDVLSFHASKGKEADYVIVLGLNAGKYGFPSTQASSSVTEAFLPIKENYPYAEERRLFYVALTRAKLGVYLITDASNPSCFVDELLVEQSKNLRSVEYLYKFR